MQLCTVDARIHTAPQVRLSNLPLAEVGSSFMVNVMSWSPAEDQPSAAQQPDVSMLYIKFKAVCFLRQYLERLQTFQLSGLEDLDERRHRHLCRR